MRNLREMKAIQVGAGYHNIYLGGRLISYSSSQVVCAATDLDGNHGNLSLPKTSKDWVEMPYLPKFHSFFCYLVPLINIKRLCGILVPFEFSACFYLWREKKGSYVFVMPKVTWKDIPYLFACRVLNPVNARFKNLNIVTEKSITMKGQEVHPCNWQRGVTRMLTLSSRQCHCVHKCNAVLLSSVCIATVFVPKVKSGEWVVVPKSWIWRACRCAINRIWWGNS